MARMLGLSTSRPLWLALLAAVVLLLAACESDAGAESAGSAESWSYGDAFHLEARAEVTDDSPLASGPEVTVLRWWWQDETHFRIEYERVDGSQDVIARDGDDRVAHYNSATGTITMQTAPELPGGAIYPASLAFALGPVQNATVEDFLGEWQAAASVDRAEVVRTDEVVGQQVEVIEYGPTWRSSSSGSGQSTSEAGGTGWIYIDPATMVILKHEVDGGDDRQSYVVAVTAIDYAPTFDEGLFAIDAPEGTVEVTPVGEQGCSSSGAGAATGWPSFPSGLLRVAHAPEGWRTVEESASQDATTCRITEVQVVLGSPDDPNDQWVAFTQRVWAGAPPGMDGEPVDLGDGRQAFASVQDGSQRLEWTQDGVWALLVSNVLDREELVRIAASATVAP